MCRFAIGTAYSTQEVAELLAWPSPRIHSFVRSGLVQPAKSQRGRYLFSFRDLVVLRAAKELIDGGLSTRKVKTALAAVAHLLPDGKPLSTVSLSKAGDHIVVRDGELWWEAVSGQAQMMFETRRPEQPRKLVLPNQHRDSDQHGDSDAWYDRALDLEDEAPADAMRAYAKAIALDNEQADAHINLGRLLQQSGQLAPAEEHYRQALACGPDNALVSFNLGTVLEDQGRDSAALEAYNAALPELADAHHNLARLYEKLGARKDAIRHLHALRVLDR